MDKVKILSFVLVFSVLVTSLFSVSRVSASGLTIVDDISTSIFSINSSGASTTLYTFGLTGVISGSEGSKFTPSNSITVSGYNPFLRIQNIHHLEAYTGGVIMSEGLEYNMSIYNFMIDIDIDSVEDNFSITNCDFSIYSLAFKFYYADGSTGSFRTISNSYFTYNSYNKCYDISFPYTPTKDVTAVDFRVIVNVPKWNSSFYGQYQSPYISVGVGSPQGLSNYFLVEEVEDNRGLLERIADGITSLFSNIRNNFSNVLGFLQDIIDTIISRLNSLGTSIVNKLSTVQSGIVNAVSNVVSGIGTLKDSLLDRLTSVKDGIVDKLENISSFFGFNASGQSELDNLNSGLNDSSSSMEEAADDLNGISSETIDIDSVVSDGLQSDGSTFLSSFSEVVNIPIISRGFITVFSVALIGYVLYGKRG